MVYRGLAKHCKRSRWFELACLVEQAEFELRCGLGPAPRQRAAAWKISANALQGECSFPKEMSLPEHFQRFSW